MMESATCSKKHTCAHQASSTTYPTAKWTKSIFTWQTTQSKSTPKTTASLRKATSSQWTPLSRSLQRNTKLLNLHNSSNIWSKCRSKSKLSWALRPSTANLNLPNTHLNWSAMISCWFWALRALKGTLNQTSKKNAHLRLSLSFRLSW
jgi:hypothetical protein